MEQSSCDPFDRLTKKTLLDQKNEISQLPQFLFNNKIKKERFFYATGKKLFKMKKFSRGTVKTNHKQIN